MHASLIVTLGIGGLALAVAALFVWGQLAAARRLGESTRQVGLFAALGTLFWLGLSALAASSGLLARFDLRPPPMALMFVAVTALGVFVGLSRAGERLALGLPLWLLIGVQGFRLPLELVMHRAAGEGVMPVEMSFSGYNFDIVTGTSALLIAALSFREQAPRFLIAAWNALGLVLLSVVAVVAFVSSPIVHAFGTDPAHVNTWVTQVPFVWLPAVLVTAALSGHIIVWRRLSAAAAQDLAKSA
ncbi:MAG TPA: hypothetical protein VGP93_02970 [Polyangiaceae bacterium]|nr:hypothetical protein [Polyangiaceae bacterium]